jgi:hypothetical protein
MNFQPSKEGTFQLNTFYIPKLILQDFPDTAEFHLVATYAFVRLQVILACPYASNHMAHVEFTCAKQMTT